MHDKAANLDEDGTVRYERDDWDIPDELKHALWVLHRFAYHHPDAPEDVKTVGVIACTRWAFSDRWYDSAREWLDKYRPVMVTSQKDQVDKKGGKR